MKRLVIQFARCDRCRLKLIAPLDSCWDSVARQHYGQGRDTSDGFVAHRGLTLLRTVANVSFDDGTNENNDLFQYQANK